MTIYDNRNLRRHRYANAMIASVSSSDNGIASHSPDTPSSRGSTINPGTMNMIPLNNIYDMDLNEVAK